MSLKKLSHTIEENLGLSSQVVMSVEVSHPNSAREEVSRWVICDLLMIGNHREIPVLSYYSSNHRILDILDDICFHYTSSQGVIATAFGLFI